LQLTEVAKMSLWAQDFQLHVPFSYFTVRQHSQWCFVVLVASGVSRF